MTDRKAQIAVIGCGAAGMAAALAAAQEGAEVTVFEKNDRAGKKLFISGKGRCNVTNACDVAELFDHFLRGKKFLYSAVYGYDNDRVRHFFTEHGCPLKVERGGRVFPVSDKSSDVIAVLTNAMKVSGIDVRYGQTVRELVLVKEESSASGQQTYKVTGIRTADGTVHEADAVILATGGLSYPATGSTGDGYRFAESAGHTVSALFPSLVPFETKEPWHRDLQGLTLKNVRFKELRKKGFDETGELLFTHFGISGPLVLSASAVCDLSGAETSFTIDLKPALTAETLDKRLQKELAEHARKQFKNSLETLFPSKLIPVMVALSEIAPEKPCGDVTAGERKAFGALIKALPVTVTATRGWNEAIVTRGGVTLKEIDPSTMASKRCKGLFFAGEILDADALTGGYNLQIAWSTGHLAGKSAASA